MTAIEGGSAGAFHSCCSLRRFICGALVLMAFSTEIGAWLHGHVGLLTGWKAGAVAILAVAVLWIVFTVLNMFATTVYYYFFNDVVPGVFMSRFFGLFRVVGSLGGMLWSGLFYQHALSYMKLIFLGAAAVYFLGFMMMCLGIKEGKYPPPPPMGAGVLAKLRTYAKDCLSHRLFTYMFAHNVFWSVSGACGIFTVFLQLSLHLTLAQIGLINFAVSGVQMVLSYPAGMLADRFHPMRVMVWIKIGLVAIVPLNFVWLFGNFPPQTAFYIIIAAGRSGIAPGAAVRYRPAADADAGLAQEPLRAVLFFQCHCPGGLRYRCEHDGRALHDGDAEAVPRRDLRPGLLLPHDPGLETALPLRCALLLVADVP